MGGTGPAYEVERESGGMIVFVLLLFVITLIAIISCIDNEEWMDDD